MLKLTKKIGMAAAFALACVSSANAIVLDTFDYGNRNFTIGNNGFTDTFVDANGSISNRNNVLLDNFGGSIPTADVYYQMNSAGGSSISTALSPGSLRLQEGNGSTLSLLYGELTQPGGAGTPAVASLSPQPFAAFGDHFYYDILQLNAGNTPATDLNVKITVNGIGGSFSYDRDYITDINTLTREYIKFSDFGAPAGFFFGVTSVQILMTVGQDVDLRLAEFGVIPEPTTVAILGLGLLGFAASRKRKA